ncbi:hypothetical protein PO081_17075 [Bacteroides thetaiotaomicron]|jgi:hypothetical protein|uniref:hypothetical protein n=1 Tax=Bacteroidales TaxID=171549 RepID=UPI00206F4AF1|nr:hypothetical protein [Bacteroides thetaiotaomicron]MDC2194996.1 hypothetical protein [Bacteroides thetaiotaomicron]UVY46892.1 MAG: hypothetical protein [Bacteriophage sp.]DAJ35868.1 MAG TPA: hypothetical protein [Caudoviricetes sp.]
MDKIALNDKQKDVIQKYKDGRYSPFFSGEDEQAAMNEVIDMANDLMDELEAYDEAGEDLIAWFWDKYQEQEKQ